jgi:predicted Zn-ribbon and HTH transcriptional regulator
MVTNLITYRRTEVDEKLRQIKLENLRAGNKKQKQAARDRYYNDPPVCKNCGKIIELREGQKPSEAKKRNFCNHSCAAQFNNAGVDRWSDKRSYLQKTFVIKDDSPRTLKCVTCGIDIAIEPKKRKDRIGLYYYHRKYCDTCAILARRKSLIAYNTKKSNGLGGLIETQTKGEVRAKAKTFQYYQIYINKHARKTYELSGKPKVCKVCGYSLHTEVCHIKDVKDFPSSALISEINHIDNLVALCRNHHWEFDHGHVKL